MKLTWVVDARGLATAYVGDEEDPKRVSVGQVYAKEDYWVCESEDNLTTHATRTAALDNVERVAREEYPGLEIPGRDATEPTKPKRRQRSDKGKPRAKKVPKPEAPTVLGDVVSQAQAYRLERDRLEAERGALADRLSALQSSLDPTTLRVVEALDKALEGAA